MALTKSNQRALSPVQQLKGLLSNPAYQTKFEEILGERKAQFVSALTSLVSANDQLQKCRPETIVKAAVDAAIMGLPIQPGLGFAYIVPYGQEAQFQLGYKGLIQLALNTGQFRRLGAGVVKKGQLVGIDEFQEPIFDWMKPGESVVGYWAGFELVNGYRKKVYLSTDECKEHAKKFSKAYAYDLKRGRSSSPWSTRFDAMSTKTVVKKVLAWAPKTLEMISASAPKALDDADESPAPAPAEHGPGPEIQVEAKPAKAKPAKAVDQDIDQDILNFDPEAKVHKEEV